MIIERKTKYSGSLLYALVIQTYGTISDLLFFCRACASGTRHTWSASATTTRRACSTSGPAAWTKPSPWRTGPAAGGAPAGWPAGQAGRRTGWESCGAAWPPGWRERDGGRRAPPSLKNFCRYRYIREQVPDYQCKSFCVGQLKEVKGRGG
jgi:hypothetical protein